MIGARYSPESRWSEVLPTFWCLNGGWADSNVKSHEEPPGDQEDPTMRSRES